MGDLNFRMILVQLKRTRRYKLQREEMVGADDDDENSVWNSCWSKADIVKETSVNRRAKLPQKLSDEDSNQTVK